MVDNRIKNSIGNEADNLIVKLFEKVTQRKMMVEGIVENIVLKRTTNVVGKNFDKRV